uniref:NADH-ubiquinone oxidoreductase chain 3 n=1 Tax=Helcomeria spinosa TaxID=2813414 RepID=A0A8T9ZXN3_9HEMI|nr:NADH dehydrogenase subunit 3 [Helcomeria spinosa]
MTKIVISIMTASILSLSLMFLCSMISKKTMMNREKMSPFECGFDPMKTARTPFSLQFFLIAVLFLIFDVEITIILPMIITLKTSNIMEWSLTVTMFIMVLIMGLFFEWKNGMLEWTF